MPYISFRTTAPTVPRLEIFHQENLSQTSEEEVLKYFLILIFYRYSTPPLTERAKSLILQGRSKP